jgi:hypothetical protein
VQLAEKAFQGGLTPEAAFQAVSSMDTELTKSVRCLLIFCLFAISAGVFFFQYRIARSLFMNALDTAIAEKDIGEGA